MHKKLTLFLIGLFSTILFLSLTWEHIFNSWSTLLRVNHIFYDANLALFYDKERSDSIIIIDIDDKSLQSIGHWPWPRDKIAAIVEKLFAHGTAVVTFDILFPEEEKNIAKTLLQRLHEKNITNPGVIKYLGAQVPHFDNDGKLANVIASHDVVLGEFFSSSLPSSTGKLGKPILDSPATNLTVLRSDKFIGNISVLANAAKYSGFTTTAPDLDGIIRRSPLLIEHQGKLYPSLSLATVETYLMTNVTSLNLRSLDGKKIFLGMDIAKNIYIPTDALGNILINYRGPARSFPYLSAMDLLEGNFDSRLLEGKIAIIGSSAIGIGDLHSTPLEAVTYPGMEIHANIVASMLDNKMIASPIWMVGAERVLLTLLGIVVTVLAISSPALVFILLSILLLIMVSALNAILFAKMGLIFPHPVLPYLQIIFLAIINSGWGYLFETRNRKKLHDIYGQYVSSTHIDKMLLSRDKHTLEGSTKLMTVLFADVRGFTSISEKLDAKDVKRFLNTLLTPLTEIIFLQRGTIDKYVGDMIMAFWNDPIDDPNHAANCVEAALKMQEKMAELTSTFTSQGIPDAALRIGINTGLMHVGDMGSSYRKAYTVLGDSVNLASRLEGVNKLYDTKILVSEATQQACANIVFRFIDSIYVKGKNSVTKIYEPIGTIGEISKTSLTELTGYQEAIELYLNRDWLHAKEQLTLLTKTYPEVELYRLYLSRATQYHREPPPPNYDLAQHLTTK